jgi:lysozyme
MAQTPEIKLNGQVRTSTLVNLRQGSPSTTAPVLRKVAAGTTLSIQAIVAGESVQGNPHWYLTDDGGYVWAGGCGPFNLVQGQTSASAALALAPPAALASPVVRVADIFHYDSVTSFVDARAGGLLGAIHKATTGASGVDDAYAGRRAQATAAGLLWGAYHWGTAAPVADQINHFLTVAQPNAQTLVALDFESTPGNQMTLDLARAFLQGISDQLNRKAVLYGGGLLAASLGDTVDPFFGSHRLWLAEYGVNPRVQASWSDFWLWQYTDGVSGPGPRFVPGIPGNSAGCVDCNYFAGSDADLGAQWAA